MMKPNDEAWVDWPLMKEAFDLATDTRKIIVLAVGVFLAAAALALSYIVGSVINIEGAYMLLMILGAIIAYLLLVAAATTVCRIAVLQTSGRGEPPDSLAAAKIARKLLPATLLPAASLMVFAGATLLGIWIVMEMGRIPYLGDMVVGVLYLPMIAAAVATVAAIVAGAAFIPAVLAIDEDEKGMAKLRIYQALKAASVKLAAKLLAGLAASAILILPLAVTVACGLAIVEWIGLGITENLTFVGMIRELSMPVLKKITITEAMAFTLISLSVGVTATLLGAVQLTFLNCYSVLVCKRILADERIKDDMR